MKIFLVVGARPNFMKAAPIIREFENKKIEYRFIHTGQHYNKNMSDVFFKDLKLPKPHINLGVGSLSHAQQTAEIMVSFEQLCINNPPDVVIVVGDVNSTIACSLVVSKIDKIKLAHIEAGLRSFDREMPEEINRIVTDVLSDCLFCTTEESVTNLRNEGIFGDKVHLVGDVMIDTLLYHSKLLKINKTSVEKVLVTLHRASNVDNKIDLESILRALEILAKEVEVIFPIHPRTKKMVNKFRLKKYLKNVKIIKPQRYLKFLELMKSSSVVLTDSGGIQVETTVLDIPCITMRNNTEHNFTLEYGSNMLVGSYKDRIVSAVFGSLERPKKTKKKNPLWDGNVAKRIIDVIRQKS